MQIKEVTKYEVDGKVFDTLEEAKECLKYDKVVQSLTEIVEKIYYRNIYLEELVDGIMENSSRICKVLKELEAGNNGN